MLAYFFGSHGVGLFLPKFLHVTRPSSVDSVGRHHGLWMPFGH